MNPSVEQLLNSEFTPDVMADALLFLLEGEYLEPDDIAAIRNTLQFLRNAIDVALERN
jgi:hypothetical protein